MVEEATTAYSLIASKTTRMLHIMHIPAFPEPRFVNLGFSGNPGIRMSGFPKIRVSGYADVRISGYPEIRSSGYPDIQKSGYSDKSNFDELARKWPFC